MSGFDPEKGVSVHASQSIGLLARWRELVRDTFVLPFTSHRDDVLPTHNTLGDKSSLPPPRSQSTGKQHPPIKHQPSRANVHTPTNLLASSSSSSSSFRPPASVPPSTSVSTNDIPHHSSSSTSSTQTSTFNSPPTYTYAPEVSHFTTLQSMFAQTLSRDIRGGVRKGYKRRQHIYEQQHKEHVKNSLERQFYDLKRSIGYEADFETFRGRLEGRGKGNNQYGRRCDNSRITLLPQDDVEFLKRAMDKASKSLHSPKPPKPFSPTIEQLNAYTKARDEQIRNRLHPKRKRIPEQLPDDVLKEIDALLQKRGVISKAGREQVTDKDLARLMPGVWLNDEIVNFYGQLIADRAAEAEATKENKQNGTKNGPNVHYFTTFFWSKLQTGYEKGRLAKWTKKLDIFSKDIIIMAINHSNAHWTSAAINFKRKRIEAYDSMGYPRKEVYTALRSYLDEEHKNKKKKPFDFTGWEDFYLENYPEQENGFDCGVFACQTLEHLSRGEEDFNFTQKNMSYFRQRMIWEIGRAKLGEPI
ncbi:hypothetical protein EW145_g414 [Phellinidium pouzarii]|uniref:Ubiquitin-like protease family profile domain-containing protein n=1 Tax=Phellinidium pouzarii TaxID=167371 RepID=A0A4S4LNX6_9AGAM|nr:hypothetical protein EW145_g414 [Phellinidium pouzarii]